jgi:hypothetical protein
MNVFIPGITVTGIGHEECTKIWDKTFVIDLRGTKSLHNGKINDFESGEIRWTGFK